MPRLLILSLTALLLLPTTAFAGGSAAVDGQRLVVTGTPETDMIYVRVSPTGELTVEQVGSDASKGPQAAGAGCTRESRSGDVLKIYCQSAGVTEVVADSGAGDDRLVFNTTLTVRADAGAGDDEVNAGSGSATIQLGDGDDALTSGGKATTTAFGGAGDDDMACVDSNTASRSKGVRRFNGGAGKDRLCGGLKDDRLIGAAGNDKLYAGEGEDELDGGAGDDILSGGDENDEIVGGSGEDELDGGSGKDLIRARDRERDDVACGSKTDTVHADRTDELSRCEVIRRR